MSWVSRWIDENVTHSTERRQIRERSERQMAEYEKDRLEMKEEHDRIDAAKKFEKARMDRKMIRRLKGGMRKSGFEENSGVATSDKLG